MYYRKKIHLDTEKWNKSCENASKYKKIWHNLIPIPKQKPSDIYLGKKPIMIWNWSYSVLFADISKVATIFIVLLTI